MTHVRKVMINLECERGRKYCFFLRYIATVLFFSDDSLHCMTRSYGNIPIHWCQDDCNMLTFISFSPRRLSYYIIDRS